MRRGSAEVPPPLGLARLRAGSANRSSRRDPVQWGQGLAACAPLPALIRAFEGYHHPLQPCANGERQRRADHQWGAGRRVGLGGSCAKSVCVRLLL